jgi:hypothetical protein
MDQKTKLRLVPFLEVERTEGGIPPSSYSNGHGIVSAPAENDQRFPDLGAGRKIQVHPGSERRRDAKRKKKIQSAIQVHGFLASTAQERLLGDHLSNGWGRLPHGITRKLKCPSQSGLRLVEIAVIMTVFDSTIARVNPTLFAAITGAEFEEQTGVDLRDIRRTLSILVSKGALLKLPAEGIIFWGLNPHFFTAKEQESSEAKPPMGDSPMGNTPRDKRGKSPTVNGGKLTPGGSSLNTQNHAGITLAKNLNQESLKESLLSGENFPADMLFRWAEMKRRGQESKSLKEIEIFEVLHSSHKQSFFENCGRVVAYLEKCGSIKNGKTQIIHSPMVWLQGHWDMNLARFAEWNARQKSLEEKSAVSLSRGAKEAVAEENQREEEKLNAEFKAKWDSVADRFLSTYPDVDAINLFVQEAIECSGNGVVSSYCKCWGWKNAIVRQTVLEHFLKVESGERTTQVRSIQC